MSFQLRPASKVALKARVALVGPSGSGKTYSALEAALALVGGEIGKVAVIDTERGSAALYADEFGEFLHGVLDPPYTPEAYLAAFQASADAGAEVLIVDSLSHAWSGAGGILEMVDDAAARNRGNSFAGWRDATPEHNRLVDSLLRWPGHVIVTMRAKTEYVIEEDDRGKKVPRKVGLAPEQRKGMEYEMDVVADVDHDHKLIITKSRCAPLQDAVQAKADREWWLPFVEWLNRGDTVQQQVAGRLDEIGFTSAQQAFIVGRYQDGASQPDELTGANAGKLLVHLADEGALRRIRAALLSDDNDPTDHDDPPAGEGDGEASDLSAGATSSDAPPASEVTDGPSQPSVPAGEDTGLTDSGSPTAETVSSPDSYDWRAAAKAAGLAPVAVFTALRRGWPTSEPEASLRPDKLGDVDARVADDPIVETEVRQLIVDLAAERDGAA